MALSTRTAAELNAELTAYSENYLNDTPLNQAWTKTPLLDYVLGDAQEADGGNELVLPVMDGATPSGGPYGVGSDITLARKNPFTQARYQFAQLYEDMYIDDVLWDKANGGGARINILEQTLDYSRLAIKELVCRMLCAATTGGATVGRDDGSTHIGSLIPMIDSTGAIGGLNPATTGQTWWAAGEDSSVGSFTTNGPAAMRTAFLNVTKYQRLGTPDVIFCSVTAYKAYEASGLNLATLNFAGGKPSGTDIGVAGSMTYKGIPLVYEPHLDALEASIGGIMLWLNTRSIKLYPKAGKVFTMKPWTDMLAGGKFGRGSAIQFTAQLGAQARAPNYKMAGITL